MRPTPKPAPPPAAPHGWILQGVRALERAGWRVTARAMEQMVQGRIDPRRVARAAQEPEHTSPAAYGDLVSRWRDGLCVLVVPDDPTHVVAVAKMPTPPRGPSRSGPRNRPKSGGAGRRMPGNQRQFLSLLHEHGFETELTGTDHVRVSHPGVPGFWEVVPSTPSDSRSLKNSIAAIRRGSGIDVTRPRERRRAGGTP